MRVEIRLSEEIEEPYVVLYTKELTEEITQLAELLKQVPEGLQAGAQIFRQAGVLTVSEEERLVVLRPEDVYSGGAGKDNRLRKNKKICKRKAAV